MPVTKTSISLSPEAATRIQERSSTGERSGQISRSLERYFAIMAYERKQLAGQFSDGEIALICDVFNGSAFMEEISIRLAWASVQDGIEMDGLDRKWEIDGPALIDKVKTLTFAQTVALVDAVEVWWNRIAHGEQPEPTIAEVLQA